MKGHMAPGLFQDLAVKGNPSHSPFMPDPLGLGYSMLNLGLSHQNRAENLAGDGGRSQFPGSLAHSFSLLVIPLHLAYLLDLAWVFPMMSGFFLYIWWLTY